MVSFFSRLNNHRYHSSHPRSSYKAVSTSTNCTVFQLSIFSSTVEKYLMFLFDYFSYSYCLRYHLSSTIFCIQCKYTSGLIDDLIKIIYDLNRAQLKKKHIYFDYCSDLRPNFGCLKYSTQS